MATEKLVPKMRIELVTPKGNTLTTIRSLDNFTAYIFAQRDVCAKCNFVLTNFQVNKTYDPIPVQEMIDMAHPDNDIDTVLLTSQYIGEDTPENTKIPIGILYLFVASLHLKSITKANAEVNRALAADLSYRQNTLSFFNQTIDLEDNRETNYVAPLNENDLINFNFTVNELPASIRESIDYLNISETENVIKKIADWKTKEKTIKGYIRSWMEAIPKD